MTHVLHRHVKSSPPVIIGGTGIYLVDRDGQRYLDSCSGVAVSSLGHGHPRVIAAIKRQADLLAYAHAGTFTTTPAEELADFLVTRSPGLSHAYFLSSGSEIVDLCLRTAYQYHVELGNPERRYFISRRQNYHGSTLAALTISGNPRRRDVFEPLLGPSLFVSPCYAYRGKAPAETDAEYVGRLAAELDDKIREVGPDRVAGFVAETVVGSTSGAVPPVPGYFVAVREVCDRHGVLLILDEVMAGSGRTGHYFGPSRYECGSFSAIVGALVG